MCGPVRRVQPELWSLTAGVLAELRASKSGGSPVGEARQGSVTKPDNK